jgi:ABC-type dipeptide/oligopeptide/nickel transport system permease subunit
MVVAGGIVQAPLLRLAGIGTTYLHHRHVPRELRPPVFVTVALRLSTAMMAAAGVYAVIVSVRG